MSRPFQVIPSFTFGPGQSTTSTDGLNGTATSIAEQQLTLAAIDAPLRYGYGRARLGALIAVAIPWYTELVLLCAHGKGPVDAVESVESDNLAAPVGVIPIHYLGEPGQGVDGTLANAFALQGKTYADTLPGIAYTVLRVPSTPEVGIDNLAFFVRQRKVFDPRSNLLPYSNTLSSWSDVGTCGVAQDATGPYGGTNYAWTLTDNDAGAHEGRTVAFTTVSGVTTYVWSVKVKKTSGGTSKTVRIDVGMAGGTAFVSITRVNTDTGATNGGTNVVVTDLGTFWKVTGEITDNASGNNALGVTLYPAVAANGSWTDAVATTGSAAVCDVQVRKSTQYAGYVATGAAGISQPTAFSENPALALADFMASTEYGRGESVDMASVAICAEINDQKVGDAARRSLSLVINEPRDVDQWQATLETYAGAWAVRDGGTVYLVPDAPAATAVQFTKARYRLETLDVEVRNRAKVPTVVTVRYTNTAVSPWASASATVKIAGVDSGTVPYQESVVDLPGIILPGHALREAYRRLYEGQLCDLTITFTALDVGLKVRKGDVIEYTDDDGFTAKPFRVIDAAVAEPGRWLIKAVEYQAGVYSDSTSSPPTIGDTTLPNPNSVPVVTGLALAEDRRYESGVWVSRFKVTWDAITDWPFVRDFLVDVYKTTGPVFQQQIITTQNECVTDPVLLGIAYTIKVRVRSSTGVIGAEATSPSTGIVASAEFGGTTQAPVLMSLTPPAVPANGSLWWKTDTGNLYVYYDDGSGPPSAQWIQIGA